MVATEEDGVLATACSGVRVHVGYSWAAEWCGKLEVVRLAQAVGVPSSAWRWAVADNLSAILGPDGGRPSRAWWVDRVRQEYARLVAATPLEEGFTPAAHNTGFVDTVAQWQSQCDDLAREGVALAMGDTHPFGDVLNGCVLLFWNDLLVVNIRHTMDLLYARAHPGPYHHTILPARDPGAMGAWATLVHDARLPREGLQWAYWLRFAAGHHQHTHDAVLCPYCLVPCSHWGLHLQRACPVAAGAVLFAFRAAMQCYGDVHWESPVSCTVGRVRWALLSDAGPWGRDLPAERVVTWSGLVWVATSRSLASSVRQDCMRRYLTALGQWLDWPADRKWAALVSGCPEPNVFSPMVIWATLLVHVMHPLSVSVHGDLGRHVARLMGGLAVAGVHWELYLDCQPPLPRRHRAILVSSGGFLTVPPQHTALALPAPLRMSLMPLCVRCPDPPLFLAGTLYPALHLIVSFP